MIILAIEEQKYSVNADHEKGIYVESHQVNTLIAGEIADNLQLPDCGVSNFNPQNSGQMGGTSLIVPRSCPTPVFNQGGYTYPSYAYSGGIALFLSNWGFVPTDQASMDRRNTVLAEMAIHPEQFIRPILQQAQCGSLAWEDANYLVFSEGANSFYHIPDRRFYSVGLPPGGWIDKGRLTYGNDLIGLCASVNNVSYDRAIEVMGENVKASRRNGDKKHYSPELAPASIPPFKTFESMRLFGMSHKKCLVYRNSAGMAIGVADYGKTATGHQVRVFQSVWRHHTSSTLHVFDIHPNDISLIYNLDMIRSNPGKTIILHDNDDLVPNTGGSSLDIAFSGGVGSASKANLELLKGQTIQWRPVFQSTESTARLVRSDVNTLEAAGANVVLLNGQGVIISRAELDRFCGDAAVVVIANDSYLSRSGDSLANDWKERPCFLALILFAGDFVILYAPEKAGKSYLAMALAYAMAQGLPFLEWTPSKKSRVFYLNGELYQEEFKDRIERIARGFGTSESNLPFDVLHMMAMPEMEDDAFFDIVRKRASNADIVIIDTVLACANRQKSRENALSNLTKEWGNQGKGVIWVDHTNAEGEIQGSLDKRRTAHLCVKLEKLPDGERIISFPTTRRLTDEESKDIRLKIEFADDAVRFLIIDDVTAKPPISDKVKRIALVFFARDHLNLSFSEIHKKHGIPTSTANDYYQKAKGGLSAQDKQDFDQEILRLKADHDRGESLKAPI